ncbi:HD-like signal output (HDOD) domain, no enzymatic activity [Desulfonatronum thiosulfatophilum]|uniref:HD-like signal output (HDOD) domain, no enzymatic activity n=1 Tax=Desulfonatronum thiosulfatophilum TaxID=617002 RepID=A0A1G6CCE7_9BACT|nr:HDOD domain-containing protein [Desulfonatronum thiosulfatophilum]SDB30566.1 HD-like signal output (HDOD) domain, no enzymatic activity [Desulfonatronum thiosulfatophilum]
MAFIKIDDITPGMSLASDLRSREGRFLLPQGAVLSERSILTCKAWGVTRAEIVGHEQEELTEARMAAIPPKFIMQAGQYIRPYLNHVDHRHPAIEEITRIAIERTAQRIAAGTPVWCDDGDGDCPHCEMVPGKSRLGDDGPRAVLHLVREQVGLISMPDIFYKIMQVMESPFSSASHIADVVAKDSSLTAKLLKLVNSAYYGFPSKIGSIRRAVALLGTKELTSLAFGISVVNTFDRIPKKVMDVESFWKHSITCGIYASLVSSWKQNLSGERFFVAGLLHDLGRLIMLKGMPDACREAICLSRKERMPLFLAERRVIGFDHAHVGGLLCREWKIPGSLEQMVRYHHAPAKAENIMEAGIVNLANLMASFTSPGACGEGVIPPLCATGWESMGIDVSDLYPAVVLAERQLEEIIQIFIGRE